MVVTLALLLTADQLAPLEGVAVVGVGVASHQLVAALVVDMRLRDHYVAALVMDVLRDAALCVLFHCNGRQNQRIGRAKHHHCRQTADGLVPTPFALVRLRVFRCLLQRILFHLSITSSLFQRSKSGQGPDPKNNLSHNLFLRHTAYRCVSGVYRRSSVVPPDRITIVRHLIGQLNIAVAQGLLFQIGFLQQLAVYVYISLFVDIHPLARTCDAALDQDLVAQIEAIRSPLSKSAPLTETTISPSLRVGVIEVP